jgi:hypothetical protein
MAAVESIMSRRLISIMSSSPRVAVFIRMIAAGMEASAARGMFGCCKIRGAMGEIRAPERLPDGAATDEHVWLLAKTSLSGPPNSLELVSIAAKSI